MGRKVDIDDLVGAHEIAIRLRIACPQVVREWRCEPRDFRELVAKMKTRLNWDWREVETWATTKHRNKKHTN